MTDSARSPDPEEGPEPAPRDEATHVTLPAFTPVPRLRERHDGWTPQRQTLFIEALADYGSVRAAANSVGLAPEGAYRLRRQPGAEEFAAAWEAALALGVKRIEDALMDRALNGVEVPVYSYGKLLGSRTVYNDRLGMFMLRNRAPHRFAAGGGPKALNAVGKMELDRLKKQWRKQWEEERRLLDDEEEKETQDSIDRFLEGMRDNRLANTSPAQREREIAAAAQARADKAAGWGPGTPYGEYAEEAARLLPKFIAEVEAEWPPLPNWAWDEPEEDEAELELSALPPPEGACPERSREEKPDEPEEPTGPHVRTMKDEGW